MPNDDLQRLMLHGATVHLFELNLIFFTICKESKGAGMIDLELNGRVFLKTHNYLPAKRLLGCYFTRVRLTVHGTFERLLRDLPFRGPVIETMI